MSMNFPTNPAVGDIHVFTDPTGRKIGFAWDGITWNRMDDPSPMAAARPGPKGPRNRGDDEQPTARPQRPSTTENAEQPDSSQ
jgi:hypothetical protein